MKKFFQNKKVLVTGATGLVGGHIVEKLLNQGASVFITRRSYNPRSYFVDMGYDKKTVSAICDIKDFDRVYDIISKYEIEYIFHVAAQPIVPTAFINPKEAFETNIMGTINILEAARKCPNIKGVVVASSDKAYGKKCDNADETSPMAGDHPYDVSKSCADLIARTYAKTYDLPVAVSRFGNIYGPGDLNTNRIVPGIMKSIIYNEELELRSDGSFIRDYVYVKDVADGYLLLMRNIDSVKGEAFNFSTGYNFSVIQIIEKISKVIGKKCKYRITNNQKNEIASQSLNYGKATNILGWKSAYTFEEGMKETYEWYKKYFNWEIDS